MKDTGKNNQAHRTKAKYIEALILPHVINKKVFHFLFYLRQEKHVFLLIIICINDAFFFPIIL